MVLRLIASAFIFFGGMEMVLEYTRHRMRRGGASLWHWLLGAVLILVGLLLFWAAPKIAARWTDDFDE